jgi:hypothetical protein
LAGGFTSDQLDFFSVTNWDFPGTMYWLSMEYGLYFDLDSNFSVKNDKSKINDDEDDDSDGFQLEPIMTTT